MMAELIHPDLSYQIVGILFKVYKGLGGGLHEKIYQRAIEQALQNGKVAFQSEVRFDLQYNGTTIGKYFIDFVIDNKIALEIKSKRTLYRSDFRQIYAYLKRSGLELGILARFGLNGVETKRVLRGYDK